MVGHQFVLQTIQKSLASLRFSEWQIVSSSHVIPYSVAEQSMLSYVLTVYLKLKSENSGNFFHPKGGEKILSQEACRSLNFWYLLRCSGLPRCL